MLWGPTAGNKFYVRIQLIVLCRWLFTFINSKFKHFGKNCQIAKKVLELRGQSCGP